MHEIGIIEVFRERKPRFISTTDDFYDEVYDAEEKYWNDDMKFVEILKSGSLSEEALYDVIKKANILWEANSSGYCGLNWDKLAEQKVETIYKLLNLYFDFINRKWPHVAERVNKKWKEYENNKKKDDFTF